MSLRKNLGARAVRDGGPPSQRWLVGSQSDPTLAEAARLNWELLGLRRRRAAVCQLRDDYGFPPDIPCSATTRHPVTAEWVAPWRLSASNSVDSGLIPVLSD